MLRLPTSTAAETSVQMGIAAELLADSKATAWPQSLYDTFDDNRNLWPYGSIPSDSVKGNRLLAEGQYRWEATALRDVQLRARPDVTPVANFVVKVEAQRIRGPADVSYGLLFRESNEDQAYAFLARDSGYFSFFLREVYGWKPIIDWTWTPEIHSGTANELKVVAEGSSFTFHINNVLVGEAQDYRLCDGWVGLALGLRAGYEVSFEFDNFELHEQ